MEFRGEPAGLLDLRQNSAMRILHTMLRVGDLQRSIDFYTNVLGMQLLRTSENPAYKYTLAFLGFEANPAQAEIELTYNWGVDKYELGTAYGHIALGVTDAYADRQFAMKNSISGNGGAAAWFRTWFFPDFVWQDV